MSHQQFYEETRQEEWEEEQSALPHHKREGYWERICEQEDMRRKELHENALLESMKNERI